MDKLAGLNVLHYTLYFTELSYSENENVAISLPKDEAFPWFSYHPTFALLAKLALD